MATWETRELTGGEVTTPGSDISAILDNLLVLRTTEEDHDLVRSIAIQKMRDSSFDTRAHLVTFSDKGLSIGAPLGKLGRSGATAARSEEHTSELQSLMRISYAVFCLKKKKHITKLIANKTNQSTHKTNKHQ